MGVVVAPHKHCWSPWTSPLHLPACWHQGDTATHIYMWKPHVKTWVSQLPSSQRPQHILSRIRAPKTLKPQRNSEKSHTHLTSKFPVSTLDFLLACAPGDTQGGIVIHSHTHHQTHPTMTMYNWVPHLPPPPLSPGAAATAATTPLLQTTGKTPSSISLQKKIFLLGQ